MPAKTPAKKAAPKSAPKAAAAKAPAKPAAKAAPATKPAAPSKGPAKPAGKAPEPPARAFGERPAGKVGGKQLTKVPTLPTEPQLGADGLPIPPPAPIDLGKHAGRDILCQIEVLKEGHFFIARTQTEGGSPKEYKNTVFEDLLTEMLITLQEQLAEK